MAKISVVIPTYNRAALLARTLASLPKDRNRVEIIVVDDGSTDETAAMVEGAGLGIHFLQQNRCGPGAARNLGWNAATGEYVAFLDSDDLWFPWTFELLQQTIRDGTEPSFVVGSPHWFAQESDLDNVREGIAKTSLYSDYLASSGEVIWISASGLLIRRDCGVRFEVEGMNAEDLDLALHLGVEKGFAWIREPATFAYRRHPGSLVADLSQTLLGIRHLVREEQRNNYPGGAHRRLERLELITRAVRPATLAGICSQQWPEAVAIYRATLGWHFRLHRWRYLIGFFAFGFLAVWKHFWNRLKLGRD